MQNRCGLSTVLVFTWPNRKLSACFADNLILVNVTHKTPKQTWLIFKLFATGGRGWDGLSKTTRGHQVSCFSLSSLVGSCSGLSLICACSHSSCFRRDLLASNDISRNLRQKHRYFTGFVFSIHTPLLPFLIRLFISFLFTDRSNYC